MNKKIFKPAISILTAAAIICTSFSFAHAAPAATLKSKTMSMTIGQKKKITIKNCKKKASYAYKLSNSKKASVSKKGVVTAKKAGKIKITVREIYKGKNRKLGIISVTIRDKSKDPAKTTVPENTMNAGTASPAPTNSPAAAPSAAPPASPTTAPTTAPTAIPTAEPTTIPSPTRTPLVIKDVNTVSGFDQKQANVEYGTISKITYHSETTGTDRHANILTPADYSVDSGKKYPVLYLFHGGNGDENDWLDGHPEYIIGNLIASGEASEMIVVMPNCRARQDDSKDPSDSLSLEHMAAWTNFLNDFTNDLMPYINGNYPVLTGRENTAIGGLSMGGRTSLYLGFSVPDKVSYIGAFSPAFGIFEYENWGLYETGYFTEDEFTFPAEYMDNTTLLIMNGADDTMVRDEPERYHNALVNNNVNHYYYTVPGDHNMTVWKNGLYNFTKLIFKE